MAADLLDRDAAVRALQTELQQAQGRRNALSKEIGKVQAQGGDSAALIAEVGALKASIQTAEDTLRERTAAFHELLATVPNPLAPDVPAGADESDNVLLRSWGEPRRFDFAPKEHDVLGAPLGMDFERAAQLSGARFVVLSGALARLERALATFMLDVQTGEHGYTEVAPPLLVRDHVLFGTGQLPKFAEDQFRTTTGYWLIATAEVPLTNLAAGAILDEAQLPLRYTAWTPCFRSEAGAAGKDTRGMIRQHQFAKVELVSIVRPEDSASRARAHDRVRRGNPETPRTAVPGDAAVRRGHRLCRAQDLRPRGVDARPGTLSRDFQLLQLRRLSGAPDARTLSRQGRARDPVGAHAERLRPRGRPHSDRPARELPAGRWQRAVAARDSTIHGRSRAPVRRWLKRPQRAMP